MLFNNQVLKGKIKDYTNYTFSLEGRAHEISIKELGKINKSDLAFLLREQVFIDIAIEISIFILKNEKIEIHSFHHNENSVEQRELIREIILVDSQYWDYYPNIFYLVVELLKDHMQVIKLPNFIKERFVNYIPEKLVWDNTKNDWYKNMIQNNAASTVLSAFENIKRLKRAILRNNKIEYLIENEKIIINNVFDFNKVLVNNLLHAETLIEYISKEKIIIEFPNNNK